MTRPKPTIAEAYAKQRAAFLRHTPFGVLLAVDIEGLMKATARDAKAAPKEVIEEISE